MSKPSARMILLPVGIVLAALAVFAILVKTRPEPPKRPAHTPQPLVEVFEITADTPSLQITGYGTVRAKRRVSLVPQVSGVIKRKDSALESGKFFLADQILLRIDETDYRLAVERAAAEVARAEYNLALAQEEAVVARREWDQLQQENGATGARNEPNPLVLKKPQLSLARAELAAAQASLEQAEVDLKRCTVRAPFAGRVLAESVDSGQYIRAGNPVATIYATDTAEITVPIPDSDLAWFRIPSGHKDIKGSAATGSEVEISAEFAGGVHQWRGRVMRMAGAIDEQSRLVPVVVEIEDPYRPTDGRPPLVEGMFVEANIIGESLPEAVAIPRAALRAENTAWVIDDDGHLEIRAVTVARAGVEQAIISQGLTPGEKICVSSLQVVSNGMLVKVADKSGSQPAESKDTVTAGGDVP